jgi:hypothetical protein
VTKMWEAVIDGACAMKTIRGFRWLLCKRLIDVKTVTGQVRSAKIHLILRLGGLSCK